MKAADFLRKIINPKGNKTGTGKYAGREIRDTRGGLKAVKLAKKGERVSRADRITRFTEWRREHEIP